MTRSRFLMIAAAAFSALSVELLAAAAPAATAPAATTLVAATAPPVATVTTPMALVAAAGAPAEPLMRVLFTWIGNDGDSWRSATNWFGASAGFPDDASDDALIDDFETGSPHLIDLSADTPIDDLTISEDNPSTLQISNDDSNGAVLDCDTIVIQGPSTGSASSSNRVTARNYVQIKTH